MSYKLLIGFESTKIGFTVEFIYRDLLVRQEQASAVSKETPRVGFVDACLAVRAGDRTGVKHVEEPSPKLDTTHLMAPKAL